MNNSQKQIVSVVKLCQANPQQGSRPWIQKSQQVYVDFSKIFDIALYGILIRIKANILNQPTVEWVQKGLNKCV